MKKMILCLLIVGLNSPALWAASQNETASHYSQKIAFKNWALSRCLSKAYGEGKPKDDGELSASAYLEQGNTGIAWYAGADALVAQFLSRRYEGSVKGDYNTMKCIDLYHSAALEKLAHQATGRR